MAAIIPFALILLGIAILPLAIPHRWEKNSAKGFFVAVITAPTAAYLLLKDASLLVHAATEYLSFIVLLASLFMVAGGIVLRGDLRGTPGGQRRPPVLWISARQPGRNDRCLDVADPSDVAREPRP